MTRYARMLRTLLLPAACTFAAAEPARALDVERAVRIDDSASVAGRQLMLNGAGVARRLVFRVYAIGLYLIDRKDTAAEVLATEGLRRITIAAPRSAGSAHWRSCACS
ncbi:MAG: chalcone isomerase family protein [Pseudomonadota bacterium]